jgi:16S rRNA (adenine1518-N6/adenine1519-N6)-dimethyltransferase
VEAQRMSFEDPRKVLARHGLSPKRSYSQNFLCAPWAVSAIAEATEAAPGHTLVELGPGCGTLTQALLERGARVVAIERDPQMRNVLALEFAGQDLEVRDGDAAEANYVALQHELGNPLRVVGNLPYAITGAIFRRLIDEHHAIHSAVVMVQREVADRLLSAPGESAYGALTVFTENVFDVERIARVPRGAFHPAPKVDSTVVRLRPKSVPLATPSPEFEAVVRAAFQGRRKTLRNALSRVPLPPGMTAADLLAQAEIDPGLRGERLHGTEFGRLARLLSEAYRRIA